MSKQSAAEQLPPEEQQLRENIKQEIEKQQPKKNLVYYEPADAWLSPHDIALIESWRKMQDDIPSEVAKRINHVVTRKPPQKPAKMSKWVKLSIASLPVTLAGYFYIQKFASSFWSNLPSWLYMNRTFSGILHDSLTVLGVGILPSLAISAPIAAALYFGLKHFIQNRRYKREYKLWWQEWCEAKAAERKIQDATIGNSIGGIAGSEEDNENSSKPVRPYRDPNAANSLAVTIFFFFLVFLFCLPIITTYPLQGLLFVMFNAAFLLHKAFK